jgi:hypothetical protein
MKFLSVLLTATIVCSNVQAQYKKANILNKDGRIYEIGTSLKQKNGGNSSSMGYYLTFGREYDHVQTYTELELVTGSKYAYTTSDVLGSNTPVNVNGKVKTSFNFRTNLGYSFLSNDDEKNKILPYINMHVGYAVMFPTAEFDYAPSNTYPTKIPVSMNGSLLYGAGAGVVIKITPIIGIRASVNYNGILSLKSLEYDSPYKTIGNQTSINVSVRFRMASKN